MNKWLQYAILLNLTLIIVFLIVDYSLWTSTADMMSPPWLSGQYEDIAIGKSYNVFSRQMWLDGSYLTSTSFEGFIEKSDTFNFPFLLFLIALGLNSYLIWRSGRDSNPGGI
jgi:hypothetical protein